MCFKGSSATSVKNVLTRTFKSNEERNVQRVENSSRKRQNLGGLPRLGLPSLLGYFSTTNDADVIAPRSVFFGIQQNKTLSLPVCAESVSK